MFIYTGNKTDGSMPMSWFKVEGRSLHHILLLFQEGYIKREFIDTNKHNTNLYVGLLNTHLHKFTDSGKYHLYLVVSAKGYIDIECYFDHDVYVARHYRPNLSTPITKTTMMTLFSRDIALPVVPVDREYSETYDVYIEPVTVSYYEIENKERCYLGESDVEEDIIEDYIDIDDNEDIDDGIVPIIV
jgi:hypothetical protein